MRELVCLVFLLGAACDKGVKASGAECKPAAAAIVNAFAKDRGVDSAVSKNAEVTITKLCVDDGWSAAARTCIAGTRTAEGFEECGHKHLTQLQDERLDDAASDLLADGAIALMQRFADKMCTCKDAKCAQSVSDEMMAWAQEQARRQKEPPKMSKRAIKRATAIGDRLGKCMQTAMSPEPPPPAPPPPAAR